MRIGRKCSTGPNVDKSSEVAPRLADVLAVHYKEMRNYDKAYLFYKEFLQRHPEDVPALVSCAENGDDAGKGEKMP